MAKRPRKRIRLVPKVSNISDLIALAESDDFHPNISYFMLDNILPYLRQLNDLIGMKELKESVFRQILYYLQRFHRRSHNEYLHTLIFGPPGSGKSTVAEILAHIYREMGILAPNGPFKRARPDDWVGQYVGQTAPRTQKFLEECLGGVCLFDEFYALSESSKNRSGFASQAINVLNRFLSEHKQDFCFIGVGYEKDIRECIFSGKRGECNEGLERRFPWVHRIDEYSPIDLARILFQKVANQDWYLNLSLEACASVIEKNKDLFKHAGGSIETWLFKCKISHAQRVFGKERRHKFVLTLEDLEQGLEMVRGHKVEEAEMEKPVPMGMYL